MVPFGFLSGRKDKLDFLNGPAPIQEIKLDFSSDGARPAAGAVLQRLPALVPGLVGFSGRHLFLFSRAGRGKKNEGRRMRSWDRSADKTPWAFVVAATFVFLVGMAGIDLHLWPRQ